MGPGTIDLGRVASDEEKEIFKELVAEKRKLLKKMRKIAERSSFKKTTTGRNATISNVNMNSDDFRVAVHRLIIKRLSILHSMNKYLNIGYIEYIQLLTGTDC